MLTKLKEFSKQCLNKKCKNTDDHLKIELNPEAVRSTGVKICVTCKTRHVYDGSGGNLMHYGREDEPIIRADDKAVK